MIREPYQTGADVRLACRNGTLSGPTPGLAMGFVQANLVILPKEFAFDFLLFCQRNTRPCPILDVTDVGNPEPRNIAADADVRTDLPAYRIWRNGELADEPADVRSAWREDFVSFLVGCSFTFENALLEAEIPVRHIEQRVNVPMYRTNRPCRSAARFGGPLVVSMRPMTPKQAETATRICSRFPRAHGTPIHVGDPQAIGISDIDRPDFGDAVEVRAGEVPVFWACGVTPQVALMEAKIPLAITHKPGHMFLTDLRDTDLEGE